MMTRDSIKFAYSHLKITWPTCVQIIMSICITGFFQNVFAGEILHLQIGDTQISSLKNKSGIQFHQQKLASNQETWPEAQTSEYKIIQFVKPISADDQRTLQTLNIRVLRYIPDDAYIVKADSFSIQQLVAANKNVRDVAPYIAEIRVNGSLQMKSVFDRQVLQTVQVQFFLGTDVDALAEKFMLKGWSVLDSDTTTMVVQLKSEDVPLLAREEGVEWISKKSHMKPMHFELPESVHVNTSQPALAEWTGYETGTKVMNFEKAWGQGFHGESQTVGVADTGLDTGEKSTLSKDLSNFDSAYVLGYSSKSWADVNGHGTHVSGSIVNNGTLSQNRVRGGAFASKLIMQSLWSEKYKTLTTPSNLQVIFQQAYGAGVRVHSDSWGDPEEKSVYNAEASQVDQFVWDHPDMLILIAAGNEGIDADGDGRVDSSSIISPATAKNIVTVGASENLVAKGGLQDKMGDIEINKVRLWPAEPLASDKFSNNARGIAGFSSRGPTLDGRIKPDVVAPGSNVLSNCSSMPKSSELWGRLDANYCFSGGTSMATPLTAAAATLIRQKMLRTYMAPSAALLKAVLINTTTDLFPGQYGQDGAARGQEILKTAPNNEEGYGLVNVGYATAADFKTIDDAQGVSTGETKDFEAASSVRRVTLVYSDAPGSPTSQKALVNDLNLEVQVGTKIFKSESRLDNVEQIFLPAITSNEKIKVIVRGVNVPMGKNGKQPFALVFSDLIGL